MEAISSVTGGANSIQTLVDQFMVPERQPITDLESSKTNLNRRVALNTLSKKSATSSNTSFLTVSASSSALVEITQ